MHASHIPPDEHKENKLCVQSSKSLKYVSMTNFNVKEDSQRDFIIQEAKKYFKDAKPTHDWNHVLRVHNLCMHIGRIEGADLEVLSYAAYLHDVGRCFEEKDINICHAQKGAEISMGILNRTSVEQTSNDAIIHCIRTHRFRDENVPSSLEAKVLYDSDKLDAIGAIGVARAYCYAGEHNQALISDFDSDYGSELSVDHSNHSPIKEYKVKLSKIKDRMLTCEGKRLAEERDIFMRKYFSRLQQECDGEL